MICHCAECGVLLLIMLSVIILHVLKLNVIVLSAVAPQLYNNIQRVVGADTNLRLLYKSVFTII
jgi:hypothetical protein